MAKPLLMAFVCPRSGSETNVIPARSRAPSTGGDEPPSTTMCSIREYVWAATEAMHRSSIATGGSRHGVTIETRGAARGSDWLTLGDNTGDVEPEDLDRDTLVQPSAVPPRHHRLSVGGDRRPRRVRRCRRRLHQSEQRDHRRSCAGAHVVTFRPQRRPIHHYRGGLSSYKQGCHVARSTVTTSICLGRSPIVKDIFQRLPRWSRLTTLRPPLTARTLMGVSGPVVGTRRLLAAVIRSRCQPAVRPIVRPRGRFQQEFDFLAPVTSDRAGGRLPIGT